MSEVKTIRVALAGCGTVGGGVAEIIIKRGDALAARTGLRFEIVKALVSDASKKREVPFDSSLFTDDPNDLANLDVDMVVEVMGGTDTACEVVIAALKRGIPVVTANKALLAHHGVEVYEAARKGNTCIAFEASCAGGLPIIGALLRGLQANRNTSIMGIFNSTCNYILTEMLSGGATYGDALKSAQQAGYAEADPTLDVGGGDTAHKLTILASLAFGLNLDGKKVAMEGIESVELSDLQIAQDLGYACKLLGIGERFDDGSVSLSVHPTLIPHSETLAGMNGTSGAVVVQGDVVGETFYAGAGAGSLPTASAVVADMVDVASGAAQKTFEQIRVYNDRTSNAQYRDSGERQYAYFVRFSIKSDDDLASCIEKLPCGGNTFVRLGSNAASADDQAVVGITNSMSESSFEKSLMEIQQAFSLTDTPKFIRILKLETN